MDIRPLTESYAVSPQISPEDLAAAAAAGYRTILCNRPDDEVPPPLQAAEIRTAAEALGLVFVENPIQPGMMTPDVVDLQRRTADTDGGPVLAYCNSGTRSTVAWMFAFAPDVPAETLLSAAREGGYALDMLKPQLDALHRG